MKLSILQENLAYGVTVAARSASAKASLPILNHLLLTTDQGRLKVSATNLEIGVNGWVGAKVEREGSLAVPARVLQDLVSSIPVGKIDLEVVKGNLHLAAPGVEANIAGIEGSEFPAIPVFNKEGAVSLSADLVAEGIEAISYAAAAEENRPVLTGVLWRVKGKTLELVATDGYRLAHKKISLTEAHKDWQAIIPARSLQELARVVKDLSARGETPDEILVNLNETENQIGFLVGGVELTTRLLEGQYPPFEQIIPSEFVVRGVFDKDRLTQGVRLAAIFARDIGSIVKLKISSTGLEISSNTIQIGDEKTQVEGSIEGEEVNVAFNSRYLLDALGHLGSSQVSFEIKSNLSPGVLKPIGDETIVVLAMPVRVQA